jgi:hypothetical protein
MTFVGLPAGRAPRVLGIRLTTGSRSVGCSEARMSCRSTIRSFVWTSNSGPSNWASRNCPVSWVPSTTRCLTRDGRGMPRRFSLPSLQLQENREPRVAKTPISSVRLNQPIPRRSGSIRERTHRMGHHPPVERLSDLVTRPRPTHRANRAAQALMPPLRLMN